MILKEFWSKKKKAAAKSDDSAKMSDTAPKKLNIAKMASLHARLEKAGKKDDAAKLYTKVVGIAGKDATEQAFTNSAKNAAVKKINKAADRPY